MVEEYLDGREYCVGFLGNGPPQILPTCEVLLGHEDGIPFFSREYKRRDRDKLEFDITLECPIHKRMVDSCRFLWDIMGLHDYARFDFRCGPDGVPRFLEVNALPGLSPVSGIFVRQAAAAGIGFDRLIDTIARRVFATID